uniref:Uncharacterized protein n=1 Tax=Glossina palpalis gambiensis TaxID=67801 RepID=A0A1B0AX90_9MUSC
MKYKISAYIRLGKSAKKDQLEKGSIAKCREYREIYFSSDNVHLLLNTTTNTTTTTITTTRVVAQQQSGTKSTRMISYLWPYIPFIKLPLHKLRYAFPMNLDDVKNIVAIQIKHSFDL